MLFLPRLTGMVRTSSPFSYTVIFLVALSTFISKARPILAVAVRSTSPYRPLLSGMPARAIRTVSVVPGFQYSGAR